MMAAGFSAVPLNSSGRWGRDRAVPRNARRAMRTAACMACFRSFSLNARSPKRIKRTPKAHGIRAVLWIELVRINPPNPRRMYVTAKSSVMEVIGSF